MDRASQSCRETTCAFPSDTSDDRNHGIATRRCTKLRDEETDNRGHQELRNEVQQSVRLIGFETPMRPRRLPDCAQIAFDLVPEARQTYPTEDDPATWKP
jgi:hypothetical protein